MVDFSLHRKVQHVYFYSLLNLDKRFHSGLYRQQKSAIPTKSIYLQITITRPEEVLRREGFTYVVPRANDYTRMFSTPARRAAPAHPESPRRDKKPRPSSTTLELPDDVQLRDRTPEDRADRNDRLSASDFYTVTDDVTPQPFKGIYC